MRHPLLSMPGRESPCPFSRYSPWRAAARGWHWKFGPCLPPGSASHWHGVVRSGGRYLLFSERSPDKLSGNRGWPWRSLHIWCRVGLPLESPHCSSHLCLEIRLRITSITKRSPSNRKHGWRGYSADVNLAVEQPAMARENFLRNSGQPLSRDAEFLASEIRR